MKTLAIIAEYNPFHNGHLYQLNTAMEITKADYSIAIMSGNFLQRGEVAMWDKYTRGRMCVSSGIDLVIELPFAYATGSAMDFARGAVSILNSLNSVDYLCFGAENPDLSLFDRVADIILQEPDEYKLQLKESLSLGMSFPAARQKALSSYLDSAELSHFISQPNNILGIEYICALKRLNSTIKPIIIERHSAGYHDTSLNRHISSATAIRQALTNNISSASPDLIAQDIPETTLRLIQELHMQSGPVFTEDLTPFLQAALISSSDFSNTCDINRDLSNKLSKACINSSYNEFIDLLTSKDYTATRVRRGIIHLLLGYTNYDRDTFIRHGMSLYANILAFKKDSSKLIKALSNTSSIPVITKKADFDDYFNEYDNIDLDVAHRLWELDTKATRLYNCLIYNRYNHKNTNDFTTKIPIL